MEDEELAQFAHLLRVVAEMARDIIAARGPEVREVYDLAIQASEIADRLDTIAHAGSRRQNTSADVPVR